MAKWTLFVVLLLPAMMCHKVTHVSISGKEPHLTPMCSNYTFSTFILCKVRTEQWSDGCLLSYRQEKGLESNCSSKVSLQIENQTVYLHLDGLTQEDNGNYNCDCSNSDGMYTVDLDVTVEVSVTAEAEDENSDSQIKVMAMGSAASAVILTVVIFGIFYSRRPHRKPQSNPPDMEPNDTEPYSTLLSRQSELYSSVSVYTHIIYK